MKVKNLLIEELQANNIFISIIMNYIVETRLNESQRSTLVDIHVGRCWYVYPLSYNTNVMSG
mgnify:CR=1 FL=1